MLSQRDHAICVGGGEKVLYSSNWVLPMLYVLYYTYNGVAATDG